MEGFWNAGSGFCGSFIVTEVVRLSCSEGSRDRTSDLFQRDFPCPENGQRNTCAPGLVSISSGTTRVPVSSLTKSNISATTCSSGKSDDQTDMRSPQLIAMILLVTLAASHAPGAAEFVRGDPNNDGDIDISDGVHLLVESDEPTRFDAADSNDSGEIDPSDTIYTLSFLFLGGVAFFNQYAAGFAPVSNEFPTFDIYNGHPAMRGLYHDHIEPVFITSTSRSTLAGIQRDGFPVYGPEEVDGSSPADLDECNGHTHATPEYPEGIYHYHITATDPYICGCFRGTPGRVTN